MRKILSLVLAILMIASVTVISASAAGSDSATVTITGFNNESSDTQTYKVGETFTSYVALNCSDVYENGMIASLKAVQNYDSDILELAEVLSTTEGEEGLVVDTDTVFPVISKGSCVANGKTAGVIKYNSSTPSTSNAFKFNSDETMLIVARYTVKAAGTATISNNIVTLATPDFYLTKIVNNSVIINDKFKVLVSLSEPAAPAGSTVSGTVTSFHSDTDEITVTLTGSDNDFIGSASVTGNTADYAIENVPDGEYVLSIEKKDHITREYAVTVSGGDVTQDATILLLGDVNGDGEITTLDYAQVNGHAKGARLISDPYLLKVADVAGDDGEVTTLDAARINAAAKGVRPLW